MFSVLCLDFPCHISSVLSREYLYMKLRLRVHRGVASLPDTTWYRCGLHLAV